MHGLEIVTENFVSSLTAMERERKKKKKKRHCDCSSVMIAKEKNEPGQSGEE